MPTVCGERAAASTRVQTAPTKIHLRTRRLTTFSTARGSASIALVQAAAETVTNQVATTNALGLTSKLELVWGPASGPTDLYRHYWSFQLGKSQCGLLESESGATFLIIGSNARKLPYSAHTTVSIFAGLSVLLVVLSLALAARFRRRKQKGAE